VENGNGGRASLRLSGPMPASCGAQDLQIVPLPAPRFAAGVVRRLWTEVGGTLAGGVREGQVAPGAELLLSWDSPTLSEVVRDINKFSNNVMARQLFLTLGLEGYGPPATPDKARAAVASWLRAKGMDFPELYVDNGSGLSRSARISARHLGELLLAAQRGPLYPELGASLPLAAVDGTMRKRLNGNAVAGQAHMKTGTLDGVRAIAGYVLDRRGRTMVVVFIANDAAGAGTQGAQDALLQWVYERDR
jgi:D-alanyl-D-alanine carboxypeptidase/D-alanyl-D-alanine-endopeptidase (penicillin-binding protein 4)